MKKNKETILVSVEGPDGVGKTTHVKKLSEALASAGYQVATAKLPTIGSFTGRLIHRMLKTGAAMRFPNFFQAIQCLDKLVFQARRLPKLVKENDYVILDRWHASMWAYGLASKANEAFTDVCVGMMREPHIVLMFQGVCKREEASDVYEKDSSFQKSVRLHYVLWQCNRGHNVCPIDSDNTVDAVHRSVITAVRSVS